MVACDEEPIRRCVPFAFQPTKSAAQAAEMIGCAAGEAAVTRATTWLSDISILTTEYPAAELKNFETRNRSIRRIESQLKGRTRLLLYFSQIKL